MVLSGEPISGAEALKWGLVSQCLPDNKALLEAAFTIANKIASKSQIASGFAKRAVRQSLELGENAGMDHERTLFMALMATNDK